MGKVCTGAMTTMLSVSVLFSRLPEGPYDKAAGMTIFLQCVLSFIIQVNEFSERWDYNVKLVSHFADYQGAFFYDPYDYLL